MPNKKKPGPGRFFPPMRRPNYYQRQGGSRILAKQFMLPRGERLTPQDTTKVMAMGFPSGTTMEALQELFSKFGEVEQVTLSLDKDKKAFASIIFKSPEAVNKINELESLEIDGTPLQLETYQKLNAIMKEQYELSKAMTNKPTCVVYVKGFESSVSDETIKEFMSQFGTVTGVQRKGFSVENQFAYVLFGTDEEATKVIENKTLDYQGTSIMVDRKWTKQQVMDLRLQELQRCVHVKNFPEGTTEEELRAALDSCGTITKVIIKETFKKSHPYAFIEYETKEAAEAAIKLTDVKIKDSTIVIQKRGRTDEYIMPMRDMVPHRALVNLPELIGKLLRNVHTLDEQMNMIVSELELSEDDYTKREDIVNDLTSLFLNFFPECDIQQFGSSVNGFGVKGTDMDVYLDLKLDSMIPAEQLEDFPKKDVPFIGDIPALENKWDREKIINLPVEDQMKLVSRIINTHSEGKYNYFLNVPSARCPVSKFCHVASGTRIDLTINNKLALNNTKLMQFYSECDPRVRPLIYTIRFWGKMKEVVGNIMSGPKLTNYALSLLVFNYLAQCSPPVLPSVRRLADDSTEKVTIDGWNCSLALDGTCTFQCQNTQTMEELLHGFFHFYAHFDFGHTVLYTRDTSCIPKSEVDNQGSEKLKTMKMSQMVVVDPFVLDHNTTQNVNLRTVGQFQYELQQAAAKMEHSKFSRKDLPSPPPALAAAAAAAAATPMQVDNDLKEEKTPAENGGKTPRPKVPDWGVTFLISRERVRAKMVASVADLQENSINLLHLGPYNLTISMKASDIPASILTTLPKESVTKRWCEEMAQYVHLVMSDLLMFEFQSATHLIEGQRGSTATNLGNSMETDDAAAVEVKRIRLEKLDPSSVIAAYKGATRYRLWQGRKNLKKQVRAKTGIADEYILECEVTKQLTAQSTPALDSILELYLTLTHEVCSGMTMVRLNLFPTVGQKEFTCFYSFFSAFVTRLADKSFTMKTLL